MSWCHCSNCQYVMPSISACLICCTNQFLLSGSPCHPWQFIEEVANHEVKRDFGSVYSRLVLCKTYRLDEDGKVLTPEEVYMPSFLLLHSCIVGCLYYSRPIPFISSCIDVWWLLIGPMMPNMLNWMWNFALSSVWASMSRFFTSGLRSWLLPHLLLPNGMLCEILLENF